MKIYNSIVSLILKKRNQRIKLFIDQPHKVQEKLRHYLINKAKNTEFGKTYDFKSINNLKDFSERIPLSTYEDLEHYIVKMRAGNQNILWPSKIKWFAKSSGTTGNKSKYIPVSKESIVDCHYKGGKDLLAIYCSNYPTKNIFNGKSVMLGGSHSISKLSSKMKEGDLSAIIMEQLPFWVRMQQSPKLSIALMDDWEEKIELMTDQAIHQNVSSLSGVPSWTLVFAKKILEKTGKKNLHEVWPNFELFMHGGISFEPYRKKFEELFPKGINYIESFNASEGYFGIQDNPNKNDLLLMLDFGIYYEFILLKNAHKNKPSVVSLSEVKLGEDYEMVITTNAGLWRYRIGDTVRFTKLHPYRFVITGRTKHNLNVFGEELMIHNAEKALQKVCTDLHLEVLEYTAAPKFTGTKGKGCHEWILEFKNAPKDLQKFRYSFDQALKNLNSDYEAKRFKNMVLEMPILHIASKNLFFKWMKNKGKLGGQNKVPRLSNERKFIEELLKLNH
ncbi:GH3 auxin-responsive promoter family protein [Flavobacteriales bacterium]|nr:GH3 auxin-responsive promoter family protein [Flavobacteriales bacterium]